MRVSPVILALFIACDNHKQEDGGSYARQVAEATPKIEKATGLKFKRPPVVEVRSRSEVRSFLERTFREQMTEQEAEGQQSAYRLLGVLPDTLDLEKFILDLLTEQVVGYYDPSTKVLYIVREAPAEQTNLIVAHELVHALQDQYTNLDSIFSIKDDNDRVTAARSVVEGQAMLASLPALGIDGDVAARLPGGWDRVRQMIRENQSSMPVFASAPLIIQETQLFPYLSGAEFVRRFGERRPGAVPYGTATPVSTEQVIHTNAYFGTARDEPSRVTLPEPRGATRVYDNNLGEFETRVVLFESLRDQNESVRAAAGWSGDRYMVVKTRHGEGLIWASVWDTQVDAAEFYGAMSDVIAKRFGSPAARERPDGGISFTSRGRALSLWAGSVADRPLVLYTDLPEGASAVSVDPRSITLQ
ncbi:MAG: hypothetical protein ABR543_02715 [Gemmatimonadaceae bacterium]